MSKINEKRTARMKTRSVKDLENFVKSGSLSAAAAEYELRKRNKIA